MLHWENFYRGLGTSMGNTSLSPVDVDSEVLLRRLALIWLRFSLSCLEPLMTGGDVVYPTSLSHAVNATNNAIGVVTSHAHQYCHEEAPCRILSAGIYRDFFGLREDKEAPCDNQF